MARRLNMDTPRSLRIAEDLDGFACVLIDREASRQQQKRALYFHLAMMACFITVVLAVPAWLAALASILLSPQFVAWRLRCRAHGLELHRIYTRGDPAVADALGEVKSKGPLPMGLGQPEPPEFIPFSEIRAVGWNDYALTLKQADGVVRELRLELTSREDIARLGRRIQQVHQDYEASLEGSAEQAEQDRRRLAAMVRGRQHS
jgi:hypothetical protein